MPSWDGIANASKPAYVEPSEKPTDMMITAKSQTASTVGSSRIEKWLGQRLFKAIGPAPIRFVLRDGTEISPAGSSPIGTVFIHDNRTLTKLMVDPEMAFGEAYAEGESM